MARIFIIGSGVVGTATGTGFERAGHDVTFVDISAARLADLRSSGLRATDSIDLSGRESFIILTLPTPHHGPGLRLLGPFGGWRGPRGAVPSGTLPGLPHRRRAIHRAGGHL